MMINGLTELINDLTELKKHKFHYGEEVNIIISMNSYKELSDFLCNRFIRRLSVSNKDNTIRGLIKYIGEI